MKLQDRVAIVTGCGRERGIGRATVMRLAKEGAHIVACEYGRTLKDYPDAKFGQMDEAGKRGGRSAQARATMPAGQGRCDR